MGMKSLLTLLFVLVLQPCLAKDINETSLIYHGDIASDNRTDKPVTGVVWWKNTTLVK